MFLVALVFGVVFAVLGFGIYFLYEKFLVVESMQLGGDADLVASSEDTAPKKGQAVDIVIKDEELPADENAGQYYVGSNRFMLNAEDVKKNSQPAKSVPPATPAPAKENAGLDSAVGNISSQAEDGFASPGESTSEKQFVPVRNIETLYNASGKEAVTKTDAPDETQEQSAKPVPPSSDEQSFSAADEQLDTLPDMDGMGVFADEVASTGYGDADINNESDFATGGVRNKNVEPPEVKDAELMAKAISTILTNEE